MGPPWETKKTGVAAPTVLGDNVIAADAGLAVFVKSLLNQLIKNHS